MKDFCKSSRSGACSMFDFQAAMTGFFEFRFAVLELMTCVAYANRREIDTNPCA